MIDWLLDEIYPDYLHNRSRIIFIAAVALTLGLVQVLYIYPQIFFWLISPMVPNVNHWGFLKRVAVWIVTHATLSLASDYYMNMLFRIIRYPFFYVLYFTELVFEAQAFQEDPLFYTDVRPYKDVDDMYTTLCADAKAKRNDSEEAMKKFKRLKHSKKEMLTRTRKLMKKLKEEEGLEIRTSDGWITKKHLKLAFEHMIHYLDDDDYLTVIIWKWISPMISRELMDEFYLNGELVAYQTSIIVGRSYTWCYWNSTEKVRKKNLYFGGQMMMLQRAISDPEIDYFNLMTHQKESCRRAKLEVSCFQLDFEAEQMKKGMKICGFDEVQIEWTRPENILNWLNAMMSTRLSQPEFWDVSKEVGF